MRDQINALPRPRPHGGARRRHRPRDAGRAGGRAARARAASASTRTRASSSTSTARPSARFQGEKQDLEEMLGNLLDNACKWARREVTLTVEAAAVDQPRAQPPADRSRSPTTGRASPTSSGPASASAACASTRPSPAPASGCRSSWTWRILRRHVRTGPTPEQGGLAVHLNLPAAELDPASQRFAAKRPAFRPSGRAH